MPFYLAMLFATAIKSQSCVDSRHCETTVHKAKNASRRAVPYKAAKTSHCEHAAIAAVRDAELEIGTVRPRGNNQIRLPMMIACKGQCRCVCLHGATMPPCPSTGSATATTTKSPSSSSLELL
jgi:hypothetical protein